MTEERGSRATEGFFGRRRGRVLRPQQAQALDAALAGYGIALDTAAPSQLSGLFKADVSAVRLEIGFGGGEHLLYRARENPHVGFIGVEPFVNGLAKVASALAASPLDNLRIYHDDATQLLDWLPPASLSGVDLFYPDPWPKKKHWKRRFVNRQNLDRMHRALKPGGVFRFASDIDHYVNWTLLACRDHGGYEWQAKTAGDWNSPYAGWPGTRYEAKAIREGRRPAYLAFHRSV